MADYSKPVAQSTGPSERKLPPMPTHCGVENCAKPPFMSLARVNVDGRVRVDVASAFLVGGSLRPGCVFLGWFSRCADCYELELRRLGRSREGEMLAGTELERQVREALARPGDQGGQGVPNPVQRDRMAAASRSAGWRLPYADD